VVLDYLVTSRARRVLLRLLWAEGYEGNVSELARKAGLSFAVAHRELEAMHAASLARRERQGNRLVYRANPEHSDAALVRALLKKRVDPPGTGGAGATDEDVRGWLHGVGAPLGGPPVRGRMPPLEQVFAAALGVAHRDATVARVLPLLLWQRRQDLDLEELVRVATRRNERHALGYFLELAGRLGEDKQLLHVANRLRDRRRSRARLFFDRPHGPLALAAVRRNTPALARKWGYLMNMNLDSFASFFAKHARRS
jgi:hypothetical protein